MKSSDNIQKNIALRFEDKTQKKIQEGSVIDMYNVSVSETLEDVYQEIEDSKNPHIFTSLTGQELDDTGFWVNCPRKDGEDDQNYTYRLMNWMLKNEASNDTAIKDSLLSPVFASNIDYVPFTKGSGTATCYVIPKYYDDTTISNALAEAAAAVKKIASPSLFVEYIIPAIRGVKLQIFIEAGQGDIALIKGNLESKIRAYINGIAPGKFLKIGNINKIGVNESGVDYFSTLSLIIDNEEVKDIEVLQEIDSKLLYDEIIWSGGY
jgi:hypothetical protein